MSRLTTLSGESWTSTDAARPVAATAVSSDAGSASRHDRAFRPDIEGLRGIAVLSVVLFHCGVAGVSGGFVGVDVFFVLSGYLITGLLLQESQRNGRISLPRFYARRARRLLPAAALVGVVTLIVGAILLGPNELRNAGRASRATSVYMSNVLFARDASDYFAPAVKTNPMLHTWSLAVEEQFYLFWPLLLIIGLQVMRSKRALMTLLAVMTVGSLAASIRMTSSAPPFAFYELPARSWEFGLGGLAVLVPRGIHRVAPRAWLVLGWAGLLTVAGSSYFITERMAFPGAVALFPVVGTAVTLLVGAESVESSLSRVLGSRPLQLLGKLSYSWYLWHWPFLVFLIALFPNVSVLGKCAAAAAALGVAAMTHHVLENPVRFHPALVRRPALSLGLGASLMAVLFLGSMAAIRFANRLSDSPSMKALDAASTDIGSMPRDKCVSLGRSPDVKTCAFGHSSDVHIVLFGDSHAIQWFNPLRRLAKQYGWRLTTVLKSGCPATDVEPRGHDSRPGTCRAWRAAAIRRIRAAKPALVIVASSSTYLPRAGQSAASARVSPAAWREGTKRTLDALSSAGLQIALMRDTPIPGFSVPECLARSARHWWYPASACAIDRSRSLNTAFDAEKIIGQSMPNVHLVDMTDEFCTGDSCPAMRQGIVVYRDDNHMTGRFAYSLLPALKEKLMPMLPSRGDGHALALTP